ncbi:MAG: DUF4105 domain-containing protein [Pseudomonadales bacterium]|nr:DUF4105 domain-containing protein [Pseudomonadales bacterium]
MRFRFSFFLLLALLPLNSIAQVSSSPFSQELQNLAISKKLYTHQAWLNLLHYKPVLLGRGYKSEVDDPSFFLAEKGKTNPKDEMLKNIDSFFTDITAITASNVTTNPSPAYCQFVARYHWLSDQLSLPNAFHTLHDINKQCPEYQAWREQLNIESAVLAFPASYLNSPSSMFGHTLFRLDPPASESQSKLLSYALNYSADTSEKDGEITYAFKGIFGGYPGYFSLPLYHTKVKNYGRIENRDVWEYALNLTKPEINRLMEHVWELKRTNFDYFFFKENCSYRLLSILEVARPGIDLTSQFQWRAIPADTVKAVKNAGLVETVNYRASAATELEYLENKLTNDEKFIVHRILENPNTLDSPSFLQLNEKRKVLVLSSTYKVVRYRAQRIKGRDPHLSKVSFALLKRRSRIKAQLDIDIEPPTRPEFGHNSQTLSLSTGRMDHQNTINFTYRPAYHQLLDNSEGYLKGAAINFLESQWQQIESKDFELTAFSILEIKSFSPRTEFLKPKSWEIRLGTERIATSGSNSLRWYLDGGLGRTYSLGHSHLLYSLATIRTERHREFNRDIALALGINIGFIRYFNLGRFSHNTFLLHFDYDNFVENSTSRTKVETGINFPLSRNSSIRFKAEYNKQHTGISHDNSGVWHTELGGIIHF